jgi:hypothetical protein
MVFASPSGQFSIEIWQSSFDNSMKVRVDLVGGGRRTTMYTHGDEALLSFVHVYWAKDESKVAVLGTGLIRIAVAAEVATGRPLAFDSVRTAVAESIRERYKVPQTETDPLQWAAMSDAQTAFFSNHKEIKLNYGPAR